jgi:predicted HAD superfamily Cof-like phosphohydrolase
MITLDYNKMKEIKNSVAFIDDVEVFNSLMGKEWQNRSTPTIDPKDAQFVIDFIAEELDELKEAVENKDIVGILDAILDITYVGLGNGSLVFGLKDKIIEGYKEVQHSNLSKICKTEEEAQETVRVRSIEQNEKCHYNKINDIYVVYRSRDNKIMKSIFYKKPNLKQFFTEEEIMDCKFK